MDDCLSPQIRYEFGYQPLDPRKREIRLIEIEPLTQYSGLDEVEKECLVQCSLKHTSLSDTPRYTALSYAWGDPRITRPIILDGQNVDVTSNLESALRQLAFQRARDPGIAPALWVDAICIDQHNETERTHQVSRMDIIYRSATQTFIWLGPSRDDSRLAVDALLKLGQVVGGLAQHLTSWSMFPFEHVAKARKAARHASETQSTSTQSGRTTGLAVSDSLDVS